MRILSRWLPAIVVTVLLAGKSAIGCPACGHTPCVIAAPPAPKFTCVTEMVPVTVMKTKTSVDFVPVGTKTVMETKIDTVYDEQTHNICKLVFKTIFENRYTTVCRPVCETAMVCQPYTVRRRVTATHCVIEVHTQMVPVVRWRMVAEQRVEKVPVTTSSTVNEVFRTKVPRLVFRNEPKTLVYKTAVVTCQEIPVTVYRPVVKMVPVVEATPQALPTSQGGAASPSEQVGLSGDERMPTQERSESIE
jgi:hypothetical protein